MLVRVTPHQVKIIREETEPINEKEINVSKCTFEFEDIEENCTKEAYFTLNGNTYKQILINNECNYPGEILTQKGELEIGVVAFLVENEEEIKRYNPTPDYYSTWKGSLKEAENSEPITPTDKEQIEQMLNNIDIQANKVGSTTTITITNADGSQQEVKIYDGGVGELDEFPTENSNNAVKSKGIKSYVDNLVGDIESILETLDIGGGISGN